MGGGALPAIDPRLKIKGGRWTVFKFFTVSVAYTSVWLAVSSELGYYRELYGPQVLLLLNIAYYAPSIPLLIFSSIFDERLESSLGVARTILVRLVVGLVGYGAICAWFPFMQAEIWSLLGAVVALGLFSSIAFSASYQMVARFANKNLIALGLGCTASGPLILILQIALGIKTIPTREQQITLFLTIFIVVAAGLWATVSLLFRHWDAIEASAAVGEADDQGATPEHLSETELGTPLLGDEETANVLHVEVRGEHTGGLGVAGGSPRGTSPLFKHATVQRLLSYNLLEPYETYLAASEDWSPGPLQRRASSPDSARRRSLSGTRRHRRSSQQSPRHEEEFVTPQGLERTISAPSETSTGFHGLPQPPKRTEKETGESPARGGTAAALSFEQQSQTSPPGASPQGGWEDACSEPASDEGFFSEDGLEEAEEATEAGAIIRAIQTGWPALVTIGVQSGISLTLFPFFTYLPSSGLFGEELPKILFFVRIFADILGRLLPRAELFKPATIWPVLAVALSKLAAEPLLFIYLKTPDSWHSDMGVLIYIALMWAASGYVNTAANMVAPHMVSMQYKSTIMALMALTYQIGHFLGLGCAVLIAKLMFGDIGVDD